jgi:hypothetical protein
LERPKPLICNYPIQIPTTWMVVAQNLLQSYQLEEMINKVEEKQILQIATNQPIIDEGKKKLFIDPIISYLVYGSHF